MDTRRGFLRMLGGAAAAAIAAPVLAKVAPCPYVLPDALEMVEATYFRPAMVAIANYIDREVLDFLEFHGVTHFDSGPYSNLMGRRFDEWTDGNSECSWLERSADPSEPGYLPRRPPDRIVLRTTTDPICVAFPDAPSLTPTSPA